MDLVVQQAVNVFDIVKGIINEKFQIRNYPYLVVDSVAQTEPDGFSLCIDNLQKFILFRFSVKAQVGFGYGEVRTNVYLGNGDKVSAEMIAAK